MAEQKARGGRLFFGPWYEKVPLTGVLELRSMRDELREKNLHDTAKLPTTDPQEPPKPENPLVRPADGAFTDPTDGKMGMAGSRFGRNFPLEEVYPDTARLMDPNPRVVSQKLLTRGPDGMIPEPILNVLAGAWIQFQTHDWFAHANDEKESHDIPLEEGDDWKTKYGQMKVKKTAADQTRPEGDTSGPPTYLNRVTHWWDGSQIYGSDAETVNKLRSHVDGKMLIGDDGFLPLEPGRGVDIAGFNDNWWLGLSLLHTLFVKEHNHICDELKPKHPDWDDDQLYHQARVINAALMAKIHTTEWTPAILPNKVISFGMAINWWGMLGKGVKSLLADLGDGVGHIGDAVELSGIVGAKKDHGPGNVPFYLTEEFVAVYRLHPLLPDSIDFKSADGDETVASKTLPEVSFDQARKALLDVGMDNAMYTMGVGIPGRIALHNYPKTLQELKTDKGEILDLGAVDVLRDRERGVPRYNDFRELIGMGRVETFEDITDNATWVQEMKEVYDGDIDKVDTMIGLFAEKRPGDFGFSETAFRVFLLMASRRLHSDPFFTDLYTKETYTDWGLEFIDDTTMLDVLARHFPSLKPHLEKRKNAFAPWNWADNIK